MSIPQRQTYRLPSRNGVARPAKRTPFWNNQVTKQAELIDMGIRSVKGLGLLGVGKMGKMGCLVGFCEKQ